MIRPEQRKTPEIVTLCGSTKFKKEFLDAQKKLTLEGSIVISVGFFGHADNDPVSEEQKIELNVLHFRKIDISDSIFVVNVKGYIGESTKREISYARSTGKFVQYLHTWYPHSKKWR